MDSVCFSRYISFSLFFIFFSYLIWILIPRFSLSIHLSFCQRRRCLVAPVHFLIFYPAPQLKRFQASCSFHIQFLFGYIVDHIFWSAYLSWPTLISLWHHTPTEHYGNITPHFIFQLDLIFAIVCLFCECHERAHWIDFDSYLCSEFDSWQNNIFSNDAHLWKLNASSPSIVIFLNKHVDMNLKWFQFCVGLNVKWVNNWMKREIYESKFLCPQVRIVHKNFVAFKWNWNLRS